MSHPWLKTFDFKQLLEEKTVATYIPEGLQDNFDEQHANHEKTINLSEQEELYSKKLLLRRDSIQHLFNGYYFDYAQEQKLIKNETSTVEKSTGSTLKSSNKELSSNQQTSKNNFMSLLSQPNRNLDIDNEESLKTKIKQTAKKLTVT